ncbi:MAG: Gfo/Idh/MocA family oxidoreductase [Bacilli bacterium]|nr:Gfo/Idh/MocA family oxidoreductase [Bacilli bacterium]
METKSLVVFGLGARGNIYASYAKTYPDKYKLVAIIENDSKRIKLGKELYPDVPLFSDYHDFLDKHIKADLVAVATQDESHLEHATAMMNAGYDLLLEKPIANNKKDCLKIYKTSLKTNRKVFVCHVLRYTPFYSTVKHIIDEGKLGDIITINASENVGYFHQAHSFVRGPWRNKAMSSPMILAKCCHDMDIIRYLMGEKCLSINSYGSLSYFKKENAPKDSADYCSKCPHKDCIYNAQKLYTSDFSRGFSSYFTTKEKTDENILKDLEGSQYDRCVFKSDNDVVDHQVTIMQFENGKTACHTMTAFSKEIYRDLKVHGTKAELVGSIESNYIEIRYFGGDIEKINIDISDANIGGHMGGDFYMMGELYKVLNGQKGDGVTYIDVSIDSHLMAFAAEESRLNKGKIVKIN